MKRIAWAALVLLLLFACGCAAPAPGPTPTPLPQVAVPGSPEPEATPMRIPGFQEGGEVEVSDIPDIKAAIQDRYEGASVGRVVMMTVDGREVYAADVTTQDGVQGTLYLLPDGTFVHGPTVTVPETSPGE